MWLNSNFLLVEEFEITDKLNVSFISLRDGRALMIEMNGQTNEVKIRTDNMELAGDIIQSLIAEYLNIEDLPSNAEFPQEIEQLKKLIARVEELQNVRQTLAAEIADNSTTIRALVVRAEDARLIGEMY